MRSIPIAAFAALLLPIAAGAHMTLQAHGAAADSDWKAVLRVPHGSDGQATSAIDVVIPDRLVAVKLMPGPGWTLETETGPDLQPYDTHGDTLTEGVRSIRWSSGSLADAHYESVFRARVAEGVAPSTLLPVRVVPRSVTAEARRNEVAAAGQDPRDLAHPAPLLRVAAGARTGHDALAGAGGHGTAGNATLGDLAIEGAVARASIGNAPTSAVYMTITTSGQPDRLVAAASPAAQAVELHTSLQEAGVSKMERAEAVPIAPDAPAELAPGGYHIMLIGLAEPLEEGMTVPLTLTFEKAGEITLDVPVSKDIAGHAH